MLFELLFLLLLLDTECGKVCVCVRNSVAKGAYAFAIADRYVIDYHSGMGRFLAMKAGKLAALGAGQPASRKRKRERKY